MTKKKKKPTYHGSDVTLIRFPGDDLLPEILQEYSYVEIDSLGEFKPLKKLLDEVLKPILDKEFQGSFKEDYSFEYSQRFVSAAELIAPVSNDGEILYGKTYWKEDRKFPNNPTDLSLGLHLGCFLGKSEVYELTDLEPILHFDFHCFAPRTVQEWERAEKAGHVTHTDDLMFWE